MREIEPPKDSSKLSGDEECARYIDLWKQTVEVQQHFNDLEWRIRGLALTAATFALGASAVAAKDGTTFFGISLGSGVLIAGLMLWFGFYFVDRYWYHTLLIGSVKHGEKLENELRVYLPQAGLTKDITAASHIEPPKGLGWITRKNPDKTLRSEEKLRIFYWIGATTLILAGLFMQLAACAPSEGPEPKPERVTEVIRPTPGPVSTPAVTPTPATVPPTTSPSAPPAPPAPPAPLPDPQGTPGG